MSTLRRGDALKRIWVRCTVGVGVLAVAIVALPTAARAAEARVDVVASGLDVPRGVAFDAEKRRVLVAEAGVGGPSLQQGGTCGLANGGARYCLGMTGAVYEYSLKSGTGQRVVGGLPSIANYDVSTGTQRRSVIGLHDLAAIDRNAFVGVFGLSGTQMPFRDQELGAGAHALGQVAWIDRKRGVLPLVDLAAFEQANNPVDGPFGTDIHSNPYGMAVGDFGAVVADAGGNDLLRVDQSGTVSLLAAFPHRDLPEFNDVIDSVPTTAVRGPDGAFYVGELTGFPYYKGYARVWRVVAGQAPTVYAEGFTNIADIAFDHTGRLIVLEMSQEGLFAGRGAIDGQPHNGDTVTGRLVRIEPDGSRTTLVTTGLENPGGVAPAPNGVFYVTNRTTSVGGTGQLLRITITG